jgi:hypothetical protein
MRSAVSSTYTFVKTVRRAALLARAHPHLSGIGFDLPQVRPVFEEFVASHGLSDRVRFESGNFFEDTLPKVDVIVMGHILHDWDLAQKKALLGKAFEALDLGEILPRPSRDNARQGGLDGIVLRWFIRVWSDLF